MVYRVRADSGQTVQRSKVCMSAVRDCVLCVRGTDVREKRERKEAVATVMELVSFQFRVL